jgi:predicted N-acetyltransferase YhbS
VSAAIGSLSHVFVDWLHHPVNPIFWPFLIDGSYYVDGLLLSRLAVLPASIIVATIAGAIMTAVIARALHKSGYNFSLVLSNPTKALSLITESLVKAN